MRTARFICLSALVLVAIPADRPAAAPTLGPVALLLGLVPATPEARVEAVVNDYVLAGSAAGIARPSPGDTALAQQYFLAMTSTANAGVGCAPAAISVPSFAAVDRDAYTAGFEVAVVGDDVFGAPTALPARSLLGDNDLRLLAVELDRLHVYAAAFTTDIFRFQQPDAGELLPFRALATGVGRTADGPFLAIAMAEPDHATALANAERLRSIATSGSSVAARRSWSTLVEVERVDAVGRVVIAVLPTKLPQLWIDLERQPDTLLWWR